MTEQGKRGLTRRQWLKACITVGGVTLVGFSEIKLAVPQDTLQGGRYLGLVDFLGEGLVPMEIPMETGLDGRLFTDLSALTPDQPITPNEKFYIRTRASEFLAGEKSWVVRVTGLLGKPIEISRAQLERMSRPAGAHLMECSGNVRYAHFGMMSVANWTGVPVAEILDTVGIEKAASHVLISGFDRYPFLSSTSVAGASWVFTIDDLKSSKAFLATQMNGVPLPKDHGAPVRLLVPGWYGCTCIKWVDEIKLLGEHAPATSQMREFAARTMQQGEPALARDYRPALIEQAAMPIRVEKWLVRQKLNYRVIGIAWGGSRPVSALEIRFNAGEDFVRVEEFAQTANDPWTFWTHTWSPIKPGVYSVQLRVKGTSVPSRRLDAGYYVRSVEITET